MYTVSQVQICACTRICIWRMYIIELLSEIVYKVYESSRSQPTRLYMVSQVQIGACTRFCIWWREEVTEVRESKKACYTCFWWRQKTIPYYLMFYKKCTKDTKRRIQVRDSMKNKYVFKLYTYNKYNLAKTYKSCTIICNILRVENRVFLKVY